MQRDKALRSYLNSNSNCKKEFGFTGRSAFIPAFHLKYRSHHLFCLLLTFFWSISSTYCSVPGDVSTLNPLSATVRSSIENTEPKDGESTTTQPLSIFPSSSPPSLNGLDNLSPLASKFLANGQLLEEKDVIEPLRLSQEPKAHMAPLLDSSVQKEQLESGKSLVALNSHGIENQPLSTSQRHSTSLNLQISRQTQPLHFSTGSTSFNLTPAQALILRIEPSLGNSTWQLGFHSNLSYQHTLPTQKVTETNVKPNIFTTTTRAPLSIREKTLPTPHQSKPSQVAVEIENAPAEDSGNQFLYPEWFGSSLGGSNNLEDGNKTVEDSVDPPDYEGGSSERRGGVLAVGEREEESPWREVTYFQSPLQRQSGHVETGSNEDVPERESPGRSAPDNPGRVATGDLSRHHSEAKGSPFYSASALDENAGLADVISRGRIDSVMYVYFGNKFNDYHKEEIAGRIIQAVGGVVAAIAHVLTVLGAAKSIRKGQHNILPVQLHIGFALLISNLLLLLAVHATEPLEVCGWVAVFLHYLHLVIGAWLLAHTVQTYRALRHYVNTPNLLGPSEGEGRPQMVPYGQRTVIAASTLRYCVITWAAPIPFILMSYLVSPNGYETHRYCWMSIEKGMLVSFILPIFLLIGLNTLLVILSLRHLLALRKLWEDPLSLEEEVLDEKAVSMGIRASAMLLPLLAIMWFLGVVALENPTSIFFQVAAALGNITLSWLVMYFLGDEIWPDICSSCPFYKNHHATNLSSSIEESTSNGVTNSEHCLPSVQPCQGVQLSFDADESRRGGGAVAAVGAGQEDVAIPGPSTALRWPHKNRSNWSRPGGNEIYELRHDAISTIYK